MRLSAATCACLVALCAPVLAQEDAFPTGRLVQDADLMQSAVVTLDRGRLFEGSRQGQAILARIEAETAALAAENRRLEAALEAEERSLTERRAVMEPEAFQTLAREFDTRVEELRVAQETKGRTLARARDLEEQRFMEAAVPILGALMRDLGAVAIIDRSAVVLGFDRIDITAQAIERLDAAYLAGTPEPAAPETEPPAEPPSGAP